MSVKFDAAELATGDYVLVEHITDPDSIDMMYIECVHWNEDGTVDIHGVLVWDDRITVLASVPADHSMEIVNA